MKYTKESRGEYATLAVVLMNQYSIPQGLVRAKMASLILEVLVPRVSHPTHRKGHPLPTIAMAFYYAESLRQGICRSAVSNHLPECEFRLANGRRALCGQALLELARVLRKMESDQSGSSISLEQWAQALDELASAANIELPLYKPADWYRLATACLDSLPMHFTSRHLGGFTTVSRYSFPSCQHIFEEVNDRHFIQAAQTLGQSDLVSAIHTPVPIATSPGPVKCPLCDNYEPLQRTEIVAASLDPRRVTIGQLPTSLWIQLHRADDSAHLTVLNSAQRHPSPPNSQGNTHPPQRQRTNQPGLSRHAVSLPKTLVINAEGKIDHPKEDSKKATLHSPRAYYDLYAVLLYYSIAERGYPPQEFAQDSGGRFSLVVFLPDVYNKIQPFWIQDGQPRIPLTQPDQLRLLETHSHAVFYSLRSQSASTPTNKIMNLPLSSLNTATARYDSDNHDDHFDDDETIIIPPTEN